MPLDVMFLLSTFVYNHANFKNHMHAWSLLFLSKHDANANRAVRIEDKHLLENAADSYGSL